MESLDDQKVQPQASGSNSKQLSKRNKTPNTKDTTANDDEAFSPLKVKKKK